MRPNRPTDEDRHRARVNMMVVAGACFVAGAAMVLIAWLING